MLEDLGNLSEIFRNYSDFDAVQLALVHQTLTLNHDLAPPAMRSSPSRSCRQRWT